MDNLGRSLWSARQQGSVLPKDAAADVTDRAAAYRVQDALAAASGLTRAGWKIAATSDLAQELLAVDGPALGPVFAEQVTVSPSAATAVPAHGTAIECEVAFVMAAAPESATRDAVIAAVDHAVIAIEVVGCRFEGGFQGAGTIACIADGAFNAGLVLGPKIDDWSVHDLAVVGAKAVVNGEVIAEGLGSAVLGDPVTALCWAVGEAIAIGRPLGPADIVSTGTMTGATAVAPGDHAVGDFGPLGRVEIQF